MLSDIEGAYPETPEEQAQCDRQREMKLAHMINMVRDAALEWGFVITIETKPLSPLRMGHYCMVVDIRKVHKNGN